MAGTDVMMRSMGPPIDLFMGEIGVRGEVFISLDKNEYSAGDTLSGHITVVVSEPMRCNGESRRSNSRQTGGVLQRWLIRLVCSVLVLQRSCSRSTARRSRSGGRNATTTRATRSSSASRWVMALEILGWHERC